MGVISDFLGGVAGKRAAREDDGDEQAMYGTYSIADGLWEAIYEGVWEEFIQHQASLSRKVSEKFTEDEPEITRRSFWIAYNSVLDQMGNPTPWDFRNLLEEYLSYELCQGLESEQESEQRDLFLADLAESLSLWTYDHGYLNSTRLELGWLGYVDDMFDIVDEFDVEASEVAERVQLCVPEIASDLAYLDANDELRDSGDIAGTILYHTGENALYAEYGEADLNEITVMLADRLGVPVVD